MALNGPLRSAVQGVTVACWEAVRGISTEQVVVDWLTLAIESKYFTNLERRR